MQGLDLNPFFCEKFRSFDDFEQMSGLWSMFWFKSFRKFFRKIAIFRNFDHWSEILSLSADRPISQDVCPPLPCTSLIFSSCHVLPSSSHPAMHFPQLFSQPCTSLFFSFCQALPSTSHPAMHSLLFSSCHALPSSAHYAMHFPHLFILSYTPLIFSSCHALPSPSHSAMQFPHLLILPCTYNILSSSHALLLSSHPSMHFSYLLILPSNFLIFSSSHAIPSFFLSYNSNIFASCKHFHHPLELS
jgi:hypothetical protein